MKKTMRRGFALSLVMVMLLAMAAAVSADSVCWSDNEGGKTLTVTVTGVKSKIVNTKYTPKNYHVKGETTLVNNIGYVSATTEAEYVRSISYQSYLIQAMNKTGLLTSSIYADSFVTTREIDANMPTGYYRLAVVFDGRTGSWGISQGMLLDGGGSAISPYSAGGVNGGTLTYAPTGGVQGLIFVLATD